MKTTDIMNKPKQGSLPNMKPEAIQTIDDAREVYVEKRDARMAMQKQETEANEQLVKAMQKYEKTIYTDGTKVVTITEEVKIKAKVSSAKITEEE